jgi:hypothetical protein
MPVIELKITEENDVKVITINIATKENITEEGKKTLQSNLQNLINLLNVKLLKKPANPGDNRAQFNIDGENVISRDYDQVGYAEELLTTLENIAVVSPENSNSNKINIFSKEEKEQILTALTESIDSIKRFPMIGDWDKTNKVHDLEKIKENIEDNINTKDSEQIKEMLKKFAAKANEYRLTKKTTTSFQMFKKKIGTILSKEDIDGIETIDQKRYQRPRPR